jgi:hypothetical protein
VQGTANGGYRGGYGYAGLFDISGSAAIEIKDCVMDGRYRWMAGIWAFEAGKMPGVPQNERGFVVTDSLFLNNWRSVGYNAQRPCEIRNCLLARPMTGMITELGDQAKLVLRNNILTSSIFAKTYGGLWRSGARFDANYNCYVWDDSNVDTRWIAAYQEKGTVFAAWQAAGKDKNSMEANPGMPLLAKMGFIPDATADQKNYPDKGPFTVAEIILPADSVARKAGENGEMIGPRWDKWLNQ